MTDSPTIGRARRAARALSRSGPLSHQQALDAIARDAGHAHWTAMLAADASDPTGGSGLRARIADYVEGYDWRGDCGDATPTDAERPVLVEAMTAFLSSSDHDVAAIGAHLDGLPPMGDRMRAFVEDAVNGFVAEHPLRGPSILLPSELLQWQYLRGPDAEPAIGPVPAEEPRPQTSSDLVALPMDPRTVAQALDPEGGPWDDAPRIVCRCPLHDDRHPSLTIAGAGDALTLACPSGCDAGALRRCLSDRMAKARRDARAFLAANARSGVYAGASIGQGGMGGRYTLDDESSHVLPVLVVRMLPEGWPRWNLGGAS